MKLSFNPSGEFNVDISPDELNSPSVQLLVKLFTEHVINSTKHKNTVDPVANIEQKKEVVETVVEEPTIVITKVNSYESLKPVMISNKKPVIIEDVSSASDSEDDEKTKKYSKKDKKKDSKEDGKKRKDKKKGSKEDKKKVESSSEAESSSEEDCAKVSESESENDKDELDSKQLEKLFKGQKNKEVLVF